ncbi:MAG: Lrp/AsnC family transcriptional regulator [Candidatus Woesearchaeota archaeon]
MDKIDKTDLYIIEELRKDSRVAFLQIAKMLSVSEGTIRNRVKNLITKGYIKNFTIELANDNVAIVGIETETKTETKRIRDDIKRLGVASIYEVTGRFDIITIVPSADMKIVNDMLEAIRSIKGVVLTETFMVLHKE